MTELEIIIMTELEIIILLTLWLLSIFFAFIVGGAMGTSYKDELKSQMVCSKCGHRGK